MKGPAGDGGQDGCFRGLQVDRRVKMKKKEAGEVHERRGGRNSRRGGRKSVNGPFHI